MRTTIETEHDCVDFINGCLFMGTGGGGDPEEGLAALRRALNDGLEVGWVDPDDIADDALTVTVYASGSIAPDVGQHDDLVRSLGVSNPTKIDDAMGSAAEALAHYLGKPIGCIVPVELGASNTPGPLVAAARAGIPVIDGDYTGRAAPDEMQGTPFIHDISSEPFASVDGWGNVAIVTQTANPMMLERVGKMLSIAGIHGTAIASTPLDGSAMKSILVPGTLSKCLAIGRAVRAACDAGSDPVDAAVAVVGGWRLFDGVVAEKTWEDRDGYMFGEVVVNGTGSFEGRELRAWFKNENHVTWLDGEPWVCSPDLVSLVAPDTGRGYTSTEISEGDMVAAVGMRGLEVHRTPDALVRAAGPAYYGFPDIEYVPIEELVDS